MTFGTQSVVNTILRFIHRRYDESTGMSIRIVQRGVAYRSGTVERAQNRGIVFAMTRRYGDAGVRRCDDTTSR